MQMVTSTGKPTLILRVLICLPLLAAQFMCSKVSDLRISGVEEPPELNGEPRKVKSLTETQRQFVEIMTSLNEKDQEKVKATVQALSTLIEQDPDYSDAYFVRAT